MNPASLAAENRFDVTSRAIMGFSDTPKKAAPSLIFLENQLSTNVEASHGIFFDTLNWLFGDNNSTTNNNDNPEIITKKRNIFERTYDYICNIFGVTLVRDENRPRSALTPLNGNEDRGGLRTADVQKNQNRRSIAWTNPSTIVTEKYGHSSDKVVPFNEEY